MSVKIQKIEDITDENLKQVSASDVSEWVKNQLQTASQQFIEEKTRLEVEAKAAQDSYTKLQTETATLQETLKTVQASLDALNSERNERIRQDVFNTRMANLDNAFELGDAERQVIASDIANLDESNFESYCKRIEILLAAKKKCAKPAKKAKGECEEEEGEEMLEGKKQCKASEKEAVESALENAKEDKSALPAAAAASEKSTIDKFKKAFAVSEWVSDVKLDS